MVAEAHGGGWGPSAAAAWKHLAKEYANASGIQISAASSEIAQRLSTILQRESARAILRMLTPNVGEQRSCNAEAWLPEDIEA